MNQLPYYGKAESGCLQRNYLFRNYFGATIPVAQDDYKTRLSVSALQQISRVGVGALK